MTFDFDELIDRRHSNSMKWDVLDHELPLWVADMDFKTALVIIDAISNKAETGIYGYSIVPEEWKSAIVNWWETRHEYSLNPEWLVFSTGVVAAITTAVKRITNVGDQILVLTPVYSVFFNSILNNGLHPIECELSYDRHVYEIDFADLEEKLAHPLTNMMILCNPHNPIGKIWSKDELEFSWKVM